MSLIRNGAVEALESEVARLREMLRVARCPNKDAKGHEQAWQCQWCDEQRELTSTVLLKHLDS